MRRRGRETEMRWGRRWRRGLGTWIHQGDANEKATEIQDEV
jgi:hypothetical protein